MANLIKIVGKMLGLPSDMLFEEIKVVLRAFGYMPKAKGSSHVVFRKQGCLPITVPKAKNKVKKCYLKRIIELLNLEEWHEKHSR
jgi:predicted RNA binding protein YcfA (HicA-like mRNA interferase family)